MKFRTAPVATLILLLTGLSAIGETRTWTAAEGGRTLQAEFQRVEDGKVVVRMQDGTTRAIPMESLSAEDQSYAKSQGAGSASGAGAGAGAGTGAGAGDWPGWQGADRTNRSTETGLLARWPRGGPEQVWIYEDGGLGYAGPAIVGGRLYTLGVRDVEEMLICLDAATGEEIYATAFGTLFTNNWGDGPRGTPTVDGGKVYCLGAKGNLACFDAASGEILWKAEMVGDFGGSVPNWGYTESPLIDGDLVICTPGGKEGALVALDKETGKKVWQSKDFTDDAQYSSPIAFDYGGVRQIAQLTMEHVVGVSAEDGEVLWTMDFNGKTAVIPTPIYLDGHVYVTAGYGVGCMLTKLPSEGAGEAEQVYKNDVMVNHHGGVVLVDGHLYGHSDKGGWKCQNFMTGEEVWAEDSFGKGAVTYADGMLYCLEEKSGEVALVEASERGWNEKGRFKLEPQSDDRSDRGAIWTHPVIAGGKLFLRDQEIIHCYDVSGK
ncbi:PQQ-like beta-propeller repeat protein [soil metagenome]